MYGLFQGDIAALASGLLISIATHTAHSLGWRLLNANSCLGGLVLT